MTSFSFFCCEIWWIKGYEKILVPRKSIVIELKRMTKQFFDAVNFVKKAKSEGILADVTLWLDVDSVKGCFGIKISYDMEFSIRIINDLLAEELPDIAYVVSRKLGAEDYPLLEVEK